MTFRSVFFVVGLALCAWAGAQSADPALVEAQRLIDAGKPAEAESAVRAYLAAHQDSADGHYLLAYILFRAGNPKSSLEEYEQGARLRSPAPLDSAVAGIDYFLTENYAAADQYLTTAVEGNPGDPQSLYFLGRTKYNEKRFSDAVDILQRCLRIDPKQSRAQHYLGLALEQLGKTDEALAAYQAAGSQFEAGALLAKLNRAQEAVPYLLKAAEAAPQDAPVRRELGKAYLALSRPDQARPLPARTGIPKARDG